MLFILVCVIVEENRGEEFVKVVPFVYTGKRRWKRRWSNIISSKWLLDDIGMVSIIFVHGCLWFGSV